MTRRSSTIRTTISPTSRKTWSRTLDDSVFPQCLNLLFRKVSHWWFCSSNGKQGKHAIGNPLLERGREEREGFEISGTESMSKKGWRNGICVSLKSHRKFCSQESLKILLCCSRSPRTLGTKSSTSYFLGKFSSEKIFWMSTSWRARTWSEEIQNTHYSSHNDSLNLKDDNYWKPINRHI